MSELKLGIMQPYFFPYAGYFSLIDYSDKFVFLIHHNISKKDGLIEIEF